MTRWQRLILYPWLVGVTLLAILWFSTLFRATFVHTSLSRTSINLALRRGSLWMNRYDAPPGSTFEIKANKEPSHSTGDPVATWFGEFSYFDLDESLISTNHLEASVPIWSLMVLLTLIAALLHLLARRHVRKKAAYLAKPPAET